MTYSTCVCGTCRCGRPACTDDHGRVTDDGELLCELCWENQ